LLLEPQTAAGHLEAAAESAREVGRLGSRLALDDFGIRLGSFTHLRTLPLGYIKIDLNFVRGLLGSADEGRVVQSIRGLTEQFDPATIVRASRARLPSILLRELGADYAQRFDVGRPVPLSRAQSSM
jgi:EAL domain-containing protein (putative c-di-GMP-specific phosphodiesterase class I)